MDKSIKSTPNLSIAKLNGKKFRNFISPALYVSYNILSNIMKNPLFMLNLFVAFSILSKYSVAVFLERLTEHFAVLEPQNQEIGEL